jgi:hypothetical protein
MAASCAEARTLCDALEAALAALYAHIRVCEQPRCRHAGAYLKGAQRAIDDISDALGYEEDDTDEQSQN